MKLGVSVKQFQDGIEKVARASRAIERQAKLRLSGDWSAKMCERIDADNLRQTLSPTFHRRIKDLPERVSVPIEAMLSVVQICELDPKESHTEIFHSRMRKTACNQMLACGFAIDYEDDEGVSFSRWMADKTLQLRRIEFR